MRVLIRKIVRFAERCFFWLVEKKTEPLLQETSFGTEHENKRFLVIRRRDRYAGLFSYFYTNLCWMLYACERGMVPVVDMQTHRNLYQRWRDWRRVNSWDIFFEQPFDYSLRDVSNAAHVLIVTGVDFDVCKLPVDVWDSSPWANDRLRLVREFVREHIKIKTERLAAYRNEELESALPSGVVGVFARGTDYVTVKPHGSTVQPPAEMVINKVREYLSNGCKSERIYLVTEDRSVACRFKEAFGDKLILSKQRFVEYDGGLLGDNADVVGAVDRGAAYLKAIVDLSRCKSLIAGRANGAAGAMLLTAGYDYTYFFDLGSYS